VAATPFSIIDDAIHSALTAWPPLTALVHADRIMQPSRSVDIRAIEAAADLAPKLWVIPAPSRIDTTAGSRDLIDLHFSYTIAIVRKNANQEDMRELEYEVHRALLMVAAGHQGNGVPLANPSPFLFISPWFTVDRVSTLHFEPGQPEAWKALFEITTRAQAERNAILPPFPTFAEFSTGAGATNITFDRPLVSGLKEASNWSQVTAGFKYVPNIVTVQSGAPETVLCVWGAPVADPGPNGISYTAVTPDIVSADFSLAALPFTDYPITVV